VLHPEDVDGVIARGVATDLGSYWAWCRERPEPILGEIAAAIEASYGGTPETAPTVYRRHSALHHAARLSMPLHLSHGGADAVIPVDQARALAARLGHRSTFVYREIPGGNHDSPLTETESFPLIWARIMGM